MIVGYSKRGTSRSTGGIINDGEVVPTHIRAAVTPLMYIFVEGVGRLRGPVPAGRPVPPWPDHTKLRHPV